MHGSSREFHAETGQTPAQASRPRSPPPLSLASSRHFRLDAYDLAEADVLDLFGNFIESAALCWRLTRGRMTQARPLSQIADIVPPLTKRALHDLSDRELADLVSLLRTEASRMRNEQAASAESG